MILSSAIPLSKILVALKWENATHFPVANNYFGELIDALRRYHTDDEILHGLRFACVICHDNASWEQVFRTEGDTSFIKLPRLEINPLMRLRDQEGLYRLSFYGEIDLGCYKRADSFKELLLLKGLRTVTPTPIDIEDTTSGGGIPKRLDSSLFRF